MTTKKQEREALEQIVKQKLSAFLAAVAAGMIQAFAASFTI